MKVLLVGADDALLEGLAQAFAAQGYSPQVVSTLYDACEASLHAAPLLAIIERNLVVSATSDALAISLAPGGSLVLYASASDDRVATPPMLQRLVLAELTLPLERNRLIALAQHVQERAQATGRANRTPPPEQRLH